MGRGERRAERRISVIIPVRNGGASFAQCLDALARVEYGAYEVVVVDDGSTDDTAAVARERGCQVVSMDRQSGPAAARNAGAREADGDILFFVDGDIVVPPHALSVVNNALADADTDAVVGILSREATFERLQNTYENLYMHYMYAGYEDTIPIFYTSAAAIERCVFEETGGFDERYTAPGIEDMAFGRRLLADGRKVRFQRELAVTHRKEFTLSQLLRVNFRKAVGTTRLILRSRGDGSGEKPVSPDWGFLLCIPLSPLALSGIAASVSLASPPLLAGSSALLLLTLVLNRGFLGFLRREKGVGFVLASLPLFWANFLTYGLGIAWGGASFFLGVRY